MAEDWVPNYACIMLLGPPIGVLIGVPLRCCQGAVKVLLLFGGPLGEAPAARGRGWCRSGDSLLGVGTLIDLSAWRWMTHPGTS